MNADLSTLNKLFSKDLLALFKTIFIGHTAYTFL